MERLRQPKTLVLALGNRIRSDDAVGLHALVMLEQDPRVHPRVRLVDGGTKGLELVPFILDTSRLLVMDAIDVGAAPGKVVRIAGQDLRALPGRGSAHELALADILNALRIMEQQPEDTVLLGVQPANTELGTELSTSVEEALPRLVEAVIAELSRWNCAIAYVDCEVRDVVERVPTLD